MNTEIVTFYSVEGLVENGNPENIQDFTRINQFDTFEQAEYNIKNYQLSKEYESANSAFDGFAIVSSNYSYDKDTGMPFEDNNSLTILKFFKK